MQWDHLRVVLAIHRGGSMQAASALLQLDRTTVLRRLDAIEKEVGARLFIRSSEGCVATQRGEEVVGTAQSIEFAMASLGRRIEAGSQIGGGVVTVTVPAFFAARVIAPSLPQFAASHPTVELRVVGSNQHLNIVQGEADIGLRNRYPEQGTLIARKAAEVAYAFYASKDYVARRGAPEGSFSGHDMLLLDESLATMLGYDRMMELSSAGHVILRSNDILTLLQAAEAGAGIAFLPSFVTLGSGKLVGVWPGAVGGLRDVFLVTHQDIRNTPRIRAVYDFMLDLCSIHADVIAGRTAYDYRPPQ
jgi:DNA-binding transcriptional LysR family regulator